MISAAVQRHLLRMSTNYTDCCVTSHLICVKLYLTYCEYMARHEETHSCFHANDEIHVSQGFQGFGFGDGGFQMSFGIGAFPFGIFATAFNINDGRPPPGISVLHI